MDESTLGEAFARSPGRPLLWLSVRVVEETQIPEVFAGEIPRHVGLIVTGTADGLLCGVSIGPRDIELQNPLSSLQSTRRCRWELPAQCLRLLDGKLEAGFAGSPISHGFSEWLLRAETR